MLKRPSQRRRSHGTQEVDLPLVPIMDAFVTLIAFLLLATSMLAVTLIDTPVPIVSSVPDDNKKDKPLALTLEIAEDSLKLSSAFRKIQPQAFPKIDKNYDLDKLHEALVAIRKQFPNEKSITFQPQAEIKYNDLIAIMDATRLFLKTDETLFVTGDDGISKPDPFLFQGVLFGNVMSGSGSGK